MADVFVLGINAYDHDASACLLRNGEIVTISIQIDPYPSRLPK